MAHRHPVWLKWAGTLSLDVNNADDHDTAAPPLADGSHSRI